MVKTSDPILNIILTYTNSFSQALQSLFADVVYTSSPVSYVLHDVVNPSNTKQLTTPLDVANFVTNGVLAYLNTYMMPKYWSATQKFKLVATFGDLDFSSFATQTDFNNFVIQQHINGITSLDNCIVINFADPVNDFVNVSWFNSLIQDGNYLGFHTHFDNTIFSFINITNTQDATATHYALCEGKGQSTVSLGLSHELAEIAVNPWGRIWVTPSQLPVLMVNEITHYPADTSDSQHVIQAYDLYKNKLQGVYYQKEIADVVRYNVIANYYAGSGSGGIYMSVTDFVFANFFVSTSHTGPFCFGETIDIANPTLQHPTIYQSWNLPTDNIFYDILGLYHSNLVIAYPFVGDLATTSDSNAIHKTFRGCKKFLKN